MRNTVGISHRLKRAWLDDVLDRLVQTTDEKELRAFVDQRLRDELPGKEARAKASGIILRIWSGIDPKHVCLRNRAVALLPSISGQERIWLHWGMTAMAYPFFRDLSEVIGRMLTLQDDFTTAQVQARIKTAWGDRATSKEAAQKLITSMVDWEVLRATKTRGHFLLVRKMTTPVVDIQLWLLEAMLSASASDEIEAQQLLRLPELFPFAFTVSVGDFRKHDGFNIHRQGLDMDMVAIRHVRTEPPTKLPAREQEATTVAQHAFFEVEPQDMDEKAEAVIAHFRQIYLKGIPATINDSSAFLSFICTLTATETLGGYICNPDATNKERFCSFVQTYFYAPYKLMVDDLWVLRNSLIHALSPAKFALTHHNHAAHLRTAGDLTVLNAEDFFQALNVAAESYFSAVRASSELQETLMQRLRHPKGGGIAVGPIAYFEPETES